MRKAVIIAAMAALPAIAFFCNAKGVGGLSANPYEDLCSSNIKGMSAPDAVPLEDPAPKSVAKPMVLAATSKTCSQRCSTTCSASCTTTRGCSSNCKSQTDGCSGSRSVAVPPAAVESGVVPRRQGLPQAVSGVSTNSAAAETGYWLSNTGKRHNKTCRYYKATRGQFCGPSGGTACAICGG